MVQLLWCTAITLLLLTGRVTARRVSPSSALSTPHTVFAAECNHYMDWQSIAVVYSHRKARVAGPITRLLTCSEADLARYPNVDLVPTHVAPSWTFNPHNNDTYLAYNKPGAIMHWLQTAPPKEDWILVIDPDMIMRDSFADWGRMYGAERGWAVSVHFGYMQGVANNLSDTHVPQIPPRQDALAGPRGRRGDQTSGVVLMQRDDLAAVAPLWLHYSEAVRDDPLAWNETGDEWAQQPGRTPWIAEMYGYSFGAASAGVWHRVDAMAQLYPGYTAHDKPLILHYGRLFETGGYKWQKHWFFSFKALQCPPWPHLRRSLADKSEAEGITGGLFPHPPHPRQFAALPALERYQQLLSTSVIATLNAALCERHLAACPPSEQLRRECGKAKAIEMAVDAAILEIERGRAPGSQRICDDTKPECQQWAAAGLCWQDPSFMHLHCRRSCSLCRLPEGMRQLAYADAQRAQQQRQQPAPGGEQAGGEEGQEGGWASAAAERRGPHVLHARAWRSTDGGTGEGGDGLLGDLTRGMLYGGLGAWAFALVALLGAILRSTWVHSKRGGLTGGGAELRGRHAWSRGGGSGRSSPRLPLLSGAHGHASGRWSQRSCRASLDDDSAIGRLGPSTGRQLLRSTSMSSQLHCV